VPCKTEIPWFVEFASKYKEEGLEVLGVSIDRDGWTVVKPFMEKMGMTYPVALGAKRIAYLYGDIDALPVTFLVDRNRRVAAIHLAWQARNSLRKRSRDFFKSLPETDVSTPARDRRRLR
jgi:peroxiredoxin